MKLNNNSPLSLQLTIEYLLSVSVLPKRFLCTCWQHWASCLLLSCQLSTSVAKSVFAAQTVHAICQHFLHPGVPSASLSASESGLWCLRAYQMALLPQEKETANRHLPRLTTHGDHPNPVL